MHQTSLESAIADIASNENDDNKATPDELILTAQNNVTLRCGKSSITLFSNGKIVIKGEYILSDAEGVNRLSGGRIEVN